MQHSRRSTQQRDAQKHVHRGCLRFMKIPSFMPPKHAVTYGLNDKVLCKFKDFYYAGKIVNVSTKDGERLFTVHYQGWHKRHDVIVPESQVKQLFLPYTVENVTRTTAELEAAKSEKKRRSKLKEVSDTASVSSLSPPVTSRRNKVVKREPIPDVNSIKYHYGCLPQSLCDILEKDNDAVINRRLLTKLPAAYPIDVLLVEFLYTHEIDLVRRADKLIITYGDEVSCTQVNYLLQSCQMITDYFNMLLGKLLLYSSERDQYQSELLRQRLLNLNGADGSSQQMHLGRRRVFQALKLMTSEFVTFIEENREKYFSVRRDYEPQE
ncbi:MRG domain-containing protein [Trichostrongylus colubriformis]|uniref:MRG domain-containing protein n=1 Tax=Trichostrongylus colubriformis TaxID=6319 RepID=A0AAN8FJL6_TRICO